MIQRCRTLVPAILVLAASAGFAQAPPRAGGESPAAGVWSEASTEHFVLLGDRPPDEIESAAVALERLHGVLSGLAPSVREDAPLTNYVFLFSNADAFAPYRLERGGGGGYVLPGAEATYAALIGARASEIVQKQFAHQLIHRQLPRSPLWLRHGLAEYTSTFEANARESRLGLPVTAHLSSLRAAPFKLVPVSELLAISELPPARGELLALSDRRFTFIAQSWALVHLMMSGELEDRRQVATYIRKLEAGDDPVAAFGDTYATPFDAIDAALVEYVQSESFSFLRVPIGASDQIRATTATLTPAQTALRLGQLLFRIGPSHRPSAEEKFRQAVALDPEQSEAWAGLGEIADEAGDRKAALEYLEKAGALASDDFRIQLALGTARYSEIDSQGEAAQVQQDVERAAAAFRRAAELRPDSGEAWSGLGRAILLASKPSPEAVEALEKAVGLLPPERTEVLYSLLLARARLGDAAGVDEAETALAAVGADRGLLHQAREVRLQVTLHHARRLASQGKADDAVALMAQVRAETSSPGVADQATALLESVASGPHHQRFLEGYAEASVLFKAGDLGGATEAVDRLAGEARTGTEAEVIEALRARIDAVGAPGDDEP